MIKLKTEIVTNIFILNLNDIILSSLLMIQENKNNIYKSKSHKKYYM